MPIQGDFISFTYNGVYSTDLGVVRVSTSNRYNDTLVPTAKEKTVEVPGGDGTYFFGSYYTQRPLTIDVAFDSVTEDQIRLMRATFGDRRPHELIFSDEPYKVYYAVSTGAPQIKYIPFNNYEVNSSNPPRVYKGEGTFTFTCYEPFAHCKNEYKYLDQWQVGQQCIPSWYHYNNKAEWNLSANLLETQGEYDTFSTPAGSTTSSLKLYNPGDIEADFQLIIEFDQNDSITLGAIKVTNGQGDLSGYNITLKTTSITKKGNDASIRFDSKTNLIEGLDSYGARTGNLYNEVLNATSWFKIPCDTTGAYNFVLVDFSGGAATLKYDYLYY